MFESRLQPQATQAAASGGSGAAAGSVPRSAPGVSDSAARRSRHAACASALAVRSPLPPHQGHGLVVSSPPSFEIT